MDTVERQSATRSLEEHGLLKHSTHHPTRRWHAALARAAADLVRGGDLRSDLRIPIAKALIEQLGTDIDDPQLAAMVELMLEFTEPTQ